MVRDSSVSRYRIVTHRARCVSHARVQNMRNGANDRRRLLTRARNIVIIFALSYDISVHVRTGSAVLSPIARGPAVLLRSSIPRNFHAYRTHLRSKSIDGYVGAVNVTESHAGIFSRISNTISKYIRMHIPDALKFVHVHVWRSALSIYQQHLYY